MLTIVVLPEPEGPNSAVTPLALSKRTWSENSPSRFSTSTESIVTPRGSAVPARRANHSEAISAASEMTIATTTSRTAAASPPGTWVSV